MAKPRDTSQPAIDTVAETVGRALGSIAGTFDSLQAQHPHPVDEAREALAAGRERAAALAAAAGATTAVVAKKARQARKKAASAAMIAVVTVKAVRRVARERENRGKSNVQDPPEDSQGRQENQAKGSQVGAARFAGR